MTVIVPLGLGTIPKRKIVEMAFSKCGMAGYEFGRTPEEVADALNHLDALMAEWEVAGLALGYLPASYGSGDPDQLSGLAASTLNAVSSHLALLIAPLMGKTLSPEAQTNLSRSMALLRAQSATVPSMPRRGDVRGAGSRGRGTFFHEGGEPLIDNPATPSTVTVVISGGS